MLFHIDFKKMHEFLLFETTLIENVEIHNEVAESGFFHDEPYRIRQ